MNKGLINRRARQRRLRLIAKARKAQRRANEKAKQIEKAQLRIVQAS